MTTQAPPRSSSTGTSEASGEGQDPGTPAPALDDLEIVERLLADAIFVEERSAGSFMRVFPPPFQPHVALN